jgi:hypothetical protein
MDEEKKRLDEYRKRKERNKTGDIKGKSVELLMRKRGISVNSDEFEQEREMNPMVNDRSDFLGIKEYLVKKL